jgi:hypothetical protein
MSEEAHARRVDGESEVSHDRDAADGIDGELDVRHPGAQHLLGESGRHRCRVLGGSSIGDSTSRELDRDSLAWVIETDHDEALARDVLEERRIHGVRFAVAG